MGPHHHDHGASLMTEGDGSGDVRAGDRLGPYEVVRFIAKGGMASVYAARDVRDDSKVAVKVLRPLGPGAESRSRFRREFRSLSKLHHPNVLRVFEWGLLGERPWYSMELVPGRDLKAEIESWRGMEHAERFTRTQGVLVQILRALDYLHERGLVHRDLTPGNVMVRPDGAVKLMDFGVVKELGSELTGVHEIMGTAAWIAPEQIEGGAVDARADLYSLGAILYTMLTGQRPFQARSLQGWLEKHLHETPRPPRELDPRIPGQLSDVCMRLLKKDPADRFASAAHLLHLLGDLEPTEQAEHWPPRMVGRTQVRARLRETLSSLEQGGPGAALLVQGQGGVGKTRVLDLAEARARRHGLTVLRAKASHDDPPFGLFSRVLTALAPDEVPEVIRETFTGSVGASRERYPVLAAFKPLLTARAPLVVILDDLHELDGASLDMLEYLVRNTVELSEESIAFILSQEVNEGVTSALEQRLEQVEALHIHTLGPLQRNEVEELLLTLVRDDETALPLAARLHAESDGSPAYLADMLRTLTDEGLLVRDGPAWRVTLDPADITRSSLPMPASLRHALTERLEPLSPRARQVAVVLALSRRHVALELLSELVDLADEPTLEAVDELVEAGIADETQGEGDEQFELAHQRFRGVLLESLSPNELRALHQRLGEAIERFHRRDIHDHVEDLAHHFEQAGIAPKACAYLIRTAHRRVQASLWEEALGYLDRALHMEPSARRYLVLEDAERALAELHLVRSQCLVAVGQPEKALRAARLATQLAELIEDPNLESRTLAEIGHQLRNRGQCEAARPWLEKALDRAIAAHDPALRTAPLYQLGAVDWTRGDLEGAEAKWRQSLQMAEAADDQRAVGFGYNGLGILAICTGQTMEARRQLERSAEVFERLGMLAPLAVVRVNLCELYHATGLLKKALTLAEITLAQAREVHHPLGTALGLTHRARALADLGRLDEALRDAREAARLTSELEAREDEIPALVTLARISIETGDLSTSLEVLDQLFPLLVEFDSEGVAPMVRALRALALARLKHQERARAELERVPSDREPWPLVRVRTDLATGEAWIALGAPERSLEVLRRALSTAETSGYRFYQLLAHHALARAVEEPGAKARHRRVASALARSLAASLPRDEGETFLSIGWGSP
ncbi:MAG: hypothetical protein EA397_10170 [Deltaproteobacteria bacterium]|nr:MAG: hypothetical protein EA397_10170 [Deltaproteobacteria bacterium]